MRTSYRLQGRIEWVDLPAVETECTIDVEPGGPQAPRFNARLRYAVLQDKLGQKRFDTFGRTACWEAS